MNTWPFLLDVVVLLAGALLLGMLFERLKQDAVIGYLLTGILLGPKGAGWIGNVEQVRALAEIGVALLLFTIGLEFSWKRLRALGPVALAGGTLQIVLTGALAILAATALGLGPAEATVAGAAISLSSTAVVLRVLTDRAEIDSLPGRNALGILLLQDLAVVPLILLISALAEGTAGLTSLSRFALAVGQAALLIAGIFLVSKYVFARTLHLASAYRNRDLPVLLAITVCLGAAAASHSFGLSPVLGAFLAGMLLAESPFAEQVRADITPLRAAFLSLFFASIGMMADPPTDHRLAVIALLALAIIGGKAVMVGLVVRVFRQPHRAAVATGLALAQIGEFSFVLMELGHKKGLMAADTFQMLLSASVLTLLVTPYAIALAPRCGELVTRLVYRLSRKPLPAASASGAPGQQGKGRVIVVGFGPAGQRVAEALGHTDIPYIVVDLNPRSVAAQRSQAPIAFGDAARPEILQHLGLPAARALIVTVPDPQTAALIVRQAKRLAPDVPVIARARYHVYSSMLHEAGADHIVDEEDMVGHWLGIESLRSIGL